jgi:hypothetical protein
MAVEVLTINPTSKKRKKGTKKGKTMAAKKKSKKTTAPKRRRRRNPSVRKTARAIGRRASSRFMGMNIMGALRGAPPRAAGMLAAKWAAKKFPGMEGGGEGDNWTFKNYLGGGIGALLAGFIAENFKRGTGQKVLEGGIDLLMYKIFMNEVVPQNSFLSNQFGADEIVSMLGEDDEPIVMLGEGEDDLDAGDMLLGDDGEIYMMGEDGYTRPISENHRMLAAEMANRALEANYAGALERPGTLGGALERPGTLGGALERPGTLGEMAVYPPSGAYAADPFMQAYNGRG